MVKKRLANGEPCRKCIQTEDMLRKRGLWEQIDHVLWADESDPNSEGFQLATSYGVDRAPFFIVNTSDGENQVYTSALKLIKNHLQPATAPTPDAPPAATTTEPQDFDQAHAQLEAATPQEVVELALRRFGRDCSIAFSGAEDVAIIHMAAQTGLPFSVFCLDTGRLHPQTYDFIERVRTHYDISIDIVMPDGSDVEVLVREKGLFSFYDDGHHECCQVRKVQPLRRALSQVQAWITGQRRDQNPATRSQLAALELDSLLGADRPLWKFNPLARWSSAEVWNYLSIHKVPTNALHALDYRSIGCAPCTRPVAPDEPERSGRWWWENEESPKECGLHVRRERSRNESNSSE